MLIDIQQIINNPLAVRSLSRIAQRIPPRIGYPLCDLIGNWIAGRRNAPLTQAVRLNQWMARGANLEKAALDQAVQETLRNNARDIYNLYHYLGKPEAMEQMINFSVQARQVIERPEFADRGLVILGLHLSNFDFILRALSQDRYRPMVLTIADPQGGRRVEFEMRKQTGMNILPVSIGSLRGAIQHLKKGGSVVTGMDRPIPHPKQQPNFFGKPASLPTHYVHLAANACVPIVIMPVIQQSDGRYQVLCSEQIEVEHDPDREIETLRNAERVLKEAEKFIRLAPQQWNVPLPVWPELVGKI